MGHTPDITENDKDGGNWRLAASVILNCSQVGEKILFFKILF